MARHRKRRITGEHFAALPVELLTSDAVCTLPAYAFRVLVAFAAEYRGGNNGDLSLTWKTAQPYGITCKGLLVASISMLLERSLLIKTRQGGKKPLGPCLYALTWRPVDELRPKIEMGPTVIASHEWAKWKLTTAVLERSVKRRNRFETNQRDSTKTSTGLSRDQETSVSGLSRDQKTSVIGTLDGPPSRSWPGGHGLAQAADGSLAPSVAPPIPSKSKTAPSKTKLVGPATSTDIEVIH
jgi:hypothetical protein